MLPSLQESCSISPLENTRLSDPNPVSSSAKLPESSVANSVTKCRFGGRSSYAMGRGRMEWWLSLWLETQYCLFEITSWQNEDPSNKIKKRKMQQCIITVEPGYDQDISKPSKVLLFQEETQLVNRSKLITLYVLLVMAAICTFRSKSDSRRTHKLQTEDLRVGATSANLTVQLLPRPELDPTNNTSIFVHFHIQSINPPDTAPRVLPPHWDPMVY